MTDVEEHILRCPVYQHLRMEKNLNVDLVDYFWNVINIREKLDEERNLQNWGKVGQFRLCQHMTIDHGVGEHDFRGNGAHSDIKNNSFVIGSAVILK